MAGRVHTHVGKAPGAEEAGRLGGKVHSKSHIDHEKDTKIVHNGITHQYSSELHPRLSHQHGQHHGQHFHYEEELHPHGCSCTKCTYTEAYCPHGIDVPKEYETKVKIVQRYPEMRTVEKTFWVKEVRHEDRIFMVPKTEKVGYEEIPHYEPRVPYLKEVTKMRKETHYEVVKKEVEYTVMVPCIEYEKKRTVDKIPRVHKEIYEEIREVPILDTAPVTRCSVEWTGKYIEEPIPVEEYCTPGDFNILCKDGRHHGDHHKSKRRTSRSSSVASFDEDRHQHVVEVAANGVPNVETPKEVHSPTPARNPTTKHDHLPNNSIPISRPIKEHEGVRNRSGSMRHDIERELHANDPFSLVHDGPSPPEGKFIVTKTKDHEGEHAKPVVPIPATTKTKEQPTKIATPTSKPNDRPEDQHHVNLAATAISPTDQHGDHQHANLPTAVSKTKDQQHEDHQDAIIIPTQAIKPKDQHEDHQHPIKIPTQAGKPKEHEGEARAKDLATTPAPSSNTKDQHEEQHQQHAKGHATPMAAATKSTKEREDHQEPLTNVHALTKNKVHEDSEPPKKVQTSTTTMSHEAAALDHESPTQAGKKKGSLSKLIKN